MALTSPQFDETQAKAVIAAYAAKFGGQLDVIHMQTGDGATVL
jgi:hypothetical protein